jgi:hypothetical protein
MILRITTKTAVGGLRGLGALADTAQSRRNMPETGEKDPASAGSFD